MAAEAGLTGTLTPTLEVCKPSKWRIAALLADRLSSEEKKKATRWQVLEMIGFMGFQKAFSATQTDDSRGFS